MKLPKRTELSEEQEDFLLDAPLDKPVMCIGPPGTGKTVLALFRAAALAKKEKQVELVMHSKLLSSYVSRSIQELGLGVESSTWHQWVYNRLWWSANAPFKIPQLEQYLPDFKRASQILVSGKIKRPIKMYWEHLIIDEGQDFPKEFYMFLSLIALDEKVLAGRPMPGLTVFADENQRLEEGRNSTIDEINGFLGGCEIHSVRKNFRNTAPIAKLAAYFYVGLRTGVPDIPDNVKGPQPVLRRFETVLQEMQSIVRWLHNNDDCSCGVIVPNRKVQKLVVDLLQDLVEPKGFRVQKYSSGQDAASIDFYKSGCITVICDKSCKGLEFDAVFLPQLQSYKTDGADEDFFRMKMYVMISRAKSFIQMSFSDCATTPMVLKMLPPPGKDLLIWQV
ncbi:AAA family ATPase [uncultured Pseudomonas sp.]|uniref:AAA family ATPase n=1 Tax=uncultured Pseudomonas sp. TaxID=114707 RepID=UPI0030DB2126|tara:strand:- start:3129 stop:4304 length:1176 start_codon:yes stop_codon:yes gene_type:complete